MEHWAFWMGGLALAGVAILNWVLTRRMLAVSGRITGIIDRVRHGPSGEEAMTSDELVAALRAATEEAFGEAAVDEPAPNAGAPTVARARTTLSHVVFLACVALGGALSTALAGGIVPTTGLRSELFSDLFEARWVQPFVLLAGGVLVGFGTRMAGGCTSGHGLCGVSRQQPGSLLTTAAFFGVGVVVSFLLRGLM